MHTEGATVVVADDGGKGTGVDRTDFAAEGSPPVTLFTIHGGGHVIPVLKAGPRIMGRTSNGILAVDEIARFFGLRR
jgi:polyhydroxybutyrate depolymerase